MEWTRLNGIVVVIKELKTSLEFTQDMFEEIKKGYKEIEKKIQSFENNIRNWWNVFPELDNIKKSVQGTSILIVGLADKKEDNWSESEKTVFDKCWG